MEERIFMTNSSLVLCWMRAHKLEFKCPFALSVLRGNTSWRPREIEIDLQHLLSSYLTPGTGTSSQRDFDIHIQLDQSMLKNTRTEVINVCEAAVVPGVHAIRKINPAVNSVAS